MFNGARGRRLPLAGRAASVTTSIMGAQQLSLAVDAQTNTWKVCDFARAADDFLIFKCAAASKIVINFKSVNNGDT